MVKLILGWAQLSTKLLKKREKRQKKRAKKPHRRAVSNSGLGFAKPMAEPLSNWRQRRENYEMMSQEVVKVGQVVTI